MSWREQIAKAILGGKVGGPTERGIQFYHSSPHDFDRFDLSKLRTGEGANVYGAGIYGAESPAVSGQGGEYWRQFQATRTFGDEKLAAELLSYNGFDRQKAIENIRRGLEESAQQFGDRVPGTPEWTTQDQNLRMRMNMRQRALDVLESDKPIIGPRTYEVNYNVDPAALIDWDKPLTAQPHVQDALYMNFLNSMPRKEATEELDMMMGRGTGQGAYFRLARDAPGGTRDPYAWASANFADQGVPGIRYLDQGSRGVDVWQPPGSKKWQAANQGVERTFNTEAEARAWAPQTYNYVAFDPSKLDIMAKYGVAGGVPLGAIAAQDQYGEGAQQ